MPVKRIPLESVAIRAARSEKMVAQDVESVAVEPEPADGGAAVVAESVKETAEVATESAPAKEKRTKKQP